MRGSHLTGGDTITEAEVETMGEEALSWRHRTTVCPQVTVFPAQGLWKQKPKEEVSCQPPGGTSPADTLVIDFWLQNDEIITVSF